MPDRFEETRSIWKKRIEEWQSSGQNIASWCREHQLDYKAFLYWKKRFSTSCSHASFTELVDAKGCIVKIEYKGVRLCLESPTLKDCLAVLIDLRC